jgi:hypothetical protein
MIFFPPKLFFGILEKGNLSKQKKFWLEKNKLSKNHFAFKKIRLLPFF